MRRLVLLLVWPLLGADQPATALPGVKRVYVDRLNGGESAAQIRDMLIGCLHRVQLFVITEDEAKADAFLRGSAEDLVFTDTFQSSESIGAHARLSGAATSGSTRNSARAGSSVGLNESESTRIAERKHEAMASVRLVGKDGDVLWSTTQESLGAKFRGASADVAEKVTKQLVADWERARKPNSSK